MASKKPIRTELQLSKLTHESKPYDVPVACRERGLVVRVSVRQKSYRWDRGRGYKPRIITYGTYPSLSLSDAIREHEKLKQRHQDGVNLDGGDDIPKTVGDLCEAFYKVVQIKRKHPDDVLVTLEKEVKPAIGRLRLRSVTTPAVAKIILDMVNRGSPGRAGKALSQIKQMFNHACAMGWMDTNPAHPLRPDDLGVVQRKKDRKLSGDEIRALRHALDIAPGMWDQVKAGIWLLLLLGLRSGELRQARWDHVDWESKTLTIPIANQKLSKKKELDAKPFVVPLSAQAIRVLEGLLPLSNDWIFPGRLNDAPLQRKAMEYAVYRLFDLKSEPLKGVPSFSPHDLRRTCRSGLSVLRIPPHIAERCLNHSLGRIVDTYDQHDYLDERREALAKWADWVERQVSTQDGVIDLAARRVQV